MHVTTSAPESTPVLYSVVVPFFNEAANVQPVLSEIAEVMRALGSYEIVAVDDCSTDATLAELRRTLPTCGCPHTLVAHAVNRGQSAALCSGFDRARGVWVITLDGDGQNDPTDIPHLLQRMASEASPPALICGHRRQRRDDVVRRLSSRIANGVRARLLGDATPDTGCGLKLVRRSAFARLPRFDHMHRFLPALIRRDGGKVISVPVSHRPRLHGRSKYGLWSRLGVGIVDLCGVMWLKRRGFIHSTVEDRIDDH